MEETVEAELAVGRQMQAERRRLCARVRLRGYRSWSVNMANLNLFVTDTPLWYRSPIGPPVEVTLSYNSQSTTARFEPVGRKWQLNYVKLPLRRPSYGRCNHLHAGRRRDVYTNGHRGLQAPYRVFNDLRMTRQGGLMEGSDYELTFPDGTIYAYQVPLGSLLWAFSPRSAIPRATTLYPSMDGASPPGEAS